MSLYINKGIAVKLPIITLVAILFMPLAGCELKEDAAIDEGAKMVAKLLRDPESARFYDLFFLEKSITNERHNGYLCGYVNSRNSFGGYTGKIRFSALMTYTKAGKVEIDYLETEEGANASTENSMQSFFEYTYWKVRCTPGWAEDRKVSKDSAQSEFWDELHLGRVSKPSKSIILAIDSPSLIGDETTPIQKGEVVTIYAKQDGWVQVSPDPMKPQWIIPELLDW